MAALASRAMGPKFKLIFGVANEPQPLVLLERSWDQERGCSDFALRKINTG